MIPIDSVGVVTVFNIAFKTIHATKYRQLSILSNNEVIQMIIDNINIRQRKLAEKGNIIFMLNFIR